MFSIIMYLSKYIIVDDKGPVWMNEILKSQVKVKNRH